MVPGQMPLIKPTVLSGSRRVSRGRIGVVDRSRDTLLPSRQVRIRPSRRDVPFHTPATSCAATITIKFIMYVMNSQQTSSSSYRAPSPVGGTGKCTRQTRSTRVCTFKAPSRVSLSMNSVLKDNDQRFERRNGVRLGL